MNSFDLILADPPWDIHMTVRRLCVEKSGFAHFSPSAALRDLIGRRSTIASHSFVTTNVGTISVMGDRKGHGIGSGAVQNLGLSENRRSKPFLMAAFRLAG